MSAIEHLDGNLFIQHIIGVLAMIDTIIAAIFRITFATLAIPSDCEQKLES